MASTTTTTTTSAPEPSHPQAHLPAPFNTTTAPLTLITQGAEALLYKTTFLHPSRPAALKIRPAKTWRHPALDRRLTRQRILAEARVLAKCRREGVVVPAVLGMSWEEGWVALEWVEGASVKEVVRGWSARGRGEEEELRGLLGRIGRAVGLLHSVGVIHGDLTTSNMILRPATSSSSSTTTDVIADTDTTSSSSHNDGGSASTGSSLSLAGEIVLIDFGLATQGVMEEDRAVDLYVLERAFGSTHPREEDLFKVVLDAYAGSYKGAKAALKRLEDVRMRGRKKSMVG